MTAELFEHGFTISLWIIKILFLIGFIWSFFLRSITGVVDALSFLIVVSIILFPAIYFIINYIYIVYIDMKNIEIDLNQGITPIRIISIYLVYRVSIIVNNIYNLLGIEPNSKEHKKIRITESRKNNIKSRIVNLTLLQFIFYSLSLSITILSLIFYGKIYFVVIIMWLLVFIFDDFNIIVDNFILSEGLAVKEHINKIKYVNYGLLILIIISLFYISEPLGFTTLITQVTFISITSGLITLIIIKCHSDMDFLLIKSVYSGNPITTHYLQDEEETK